MYQNEFIFYRPTFIDREPNIFIKVFDNKFNSTNSKVIKSLFWPTKFYICRNFYCLAQKIFDRINYLLSKYNE